MFRYETWCYSINLVYFNGLLLTYFVVDFFISLMCLWLEKTAVLLICIHKLVKSIIFTVSIKFCDESGLGILSNKALYMVSIHKVHACTCNVDMHTGRPPVLKMF